MSCGKYTFTIKQGETFYRRIGYKDPYGLPVDLTDYRGLLQIRPNKGSSTIYATLSSSLAPDGTGLNFTPSSQSFSGSTVTTYILPPSSGSIGLTITGYSSSLFSFDTAEGDLFIYSGSGVSTFTDHVAEFKFKLIKSTTINTFV